VDTILALQRFASPGLDRFMLLVTDLGSQEAYTVLLILAYLAVDAAFGRRLGVVFLTGAYLNDLVKEQFAAPRPFVVDPAVARSGAAIETAPGNSFPSGHAQSAIIFWGLAALQFKRLWFWVLAAVVVGLIALSRVYLGVHFPRDVWGGLVFGAIIVLASLLVRRLALSPGSVATLALGLVAPFALHLLAPTPNSNVYLSVVSAFIVGPAVVTHRANGSVIGRLLMGLVGLLLVAAVMGASSALMPEELKRGAVGGYLRYLAIGLTGTLVAPLACRVLRLSGGPVVAASASKSV